MLQKQVEAILGAEKQKNEGLLEEQRSLQAQCEDLHKKVEEEKEAKIKVGWILVMKVNFLCFLRVFMHCYGANYYMGNI